MSRIDPTTDRIVPLLPGLLACAILALLAAPAAAKPVSFRVPSAVRPGQVRRFWTAARMRRAKPIAPRTASRGGLVPASPRRPVRAKPHVYPPRTANGAPRARASVEQVADPTQAGMRQNGAIFISEGPHAGFGRCSGTSVNAPNLSLVVTAGHCVHEFGRWSAHKFVFVPGYHHGERPFGTFVAKWIGTTSQWLRHENENFDVGMAVVGRNERGQRLAAAVGADGIAWGLSPNQVFDVYGYPVARPFDGATLQLCPQTAYEGHDLVSFLMPGPLDLAVRCADSPGGSGGGWVIRGNVLNSITTNGYPEDPSTDYGPYFGRAVGHLFARAASVR